MIRIGIVGHRYLGSKKVIDFVFQNCSAILKKVLVEYSHVVALSAIAEGADSLFAEAALLQGIPLEIVKPFQEYATDFKTIFAREHYDRLRAAACSEKKLYYVDRSEEAYLRAMDWIVERSDILIAAWNGSLDNDSCGTGYAVKQAILSDNTWIHLNVVNLTITIHSADKEVRRIGKWQLIIDNLIGSYRR